jgi:hypothetical protein
VEEKGGCLALGHIPKPLPERFPDIFINASRIFLTPGTDHINEKGSFYTPLFIIYEIGSETAGFRD